MIRIPLTAFAALMLPTFANAQVIFADGFENVWFNVTPATVDLSHPLGCGNYGKKGDGGS